MVSEVRVERCRSCGAAIVWGYTKNGRPCPYDFVDGQATTVSHFATCPQASRWSKRNTKEGGGLP